MFCQRLGVVNHANTFDLFEGNGNQATIYREFRISRDIRKSHLLYVRKDLVDQYLCAIGCSLVWVPWGERRFNYRGFEQVVQKLPTGVDAWFVHKGLAVYKG